MAKQTKKGDVVIINFTNANAQGVAFELNKRAKLIDAPKMESDRFFINWDKIGEAIFVDYCDPKDEKRLEKLREDGIAAKEKVKVTPEVSMFNAHLAGYVTARNGNKLISMVKALELTRESWERWKNIYKDTLGELDIEEVDVYFNEKEAEDKAKALPTKKK